MSELGVLARTYLGGGTDSCDVAYAQIGSAMSRRGLHQRNQKAHRPAQVRTQVDGWGIRLGFAIAAKNLLI